MKKLYIFCHYRGVEDGVSATEGITYEELIASICDRLHINPCGKVFRYTLRFEKSRTQPLRDDVGVSHLMDFNDDSSHIYVFDAEEEPLPIPDVVLPDMASRMCSTNPQSNLSSPAILDSCSPSDESLAQTFGGVIPLASAVWENTIQAEGHMFRDASAFKEALYRYSIAKRFCYKYKRNEKQRIQACCGVDGCPWFINAVAVKNSQAMRVKDFNDTHKHSAEEECSSRVSVKSQRLATVLVDTIRDSPDTLPQDIRLDMLRNHAIKLSYNQSWRAKEYSKLLIYGKPEDNYRLVPLICKKTVDANPGSVAKCITTDDGRFKQLFMAYGCSINGFIFGCRPMLFVDSCHLSGPYKGALFSATALDADDHMFPLAYRIVSSENYEDWLWFLKEVKAVIRSVEVIVFSDRHQALLSSVAEVFGVENHVHCYRHIKENFSTEFNKLRLGKKKAKDHAMSLLDDVAYARVEFDYEIAMRALHDYCPELGTWVERNAPQHWAISKVGAMRWDRMNTNLAESFNSWVRKERHFSIVQFIHAHRDKLARKIYNQKVELDNWEFDVGPKINEKLLEKIEKAKTIKAERYSTLKFSIKLGGPEIKVNLLEGWCTCMEWKMSGLPCVHACAAIREADFNIYHYVDPFYKRESQEKIYSECMEPIETHDLPTLTQGSNEQISPNCDGVPLDVRPPRIKRPPGRPRVKRIESQFMEKRVVHCSHCCAPGHNRASCKNPIPDA